MKITANITLLSSLYMLSKHNELFVASPGNGRLNLVSVAPLISGFAHSFASHAGVCVCRGDTDVCEDALSSLLLQGTKRFIAF